MTKFSARSLFKMSRIWRQVLALSLSFQMVGLNAHAAEPDGSPGGDVGTMQIMDLSSNTVSFEFKSEIIEVNSGDVPSTLRTLYGRKASTTVYSSDREDLLLEGAREGEPENTAERKIAVVPMGDLFKGKKNGINQYFREYANNVKRAAKIDPLGFGIGMAVLTWSQGVDTFQWIHATDLSRVERGAAIAYSIVTTLLLSVDKTAWSKATKPIQNVMRKAIKMGEVPADKTSAPDIAIKMFSSMALVAAINYGRIPFIAIDDIMGGTFDPNLLLKPIAVSLALGAASFAWMETVGTVDREKNPKARFVLERMIESRGFIVGTFASTAMLFNFNQFGASPWFTLGAAGASGVALYCNRQKFIKAVESIPSLTELRDRVFKNRGKRAPMLCPMVL